MSNPSCKPTTRRLKVKGVLVLSLACLPFVLLKWDRPSAPSRVLLEVRSRTVSSQQSQTLIALSAANGTEISTPLQKNQSVDSSFLGQVCPKEKWGPMLPAIARWSVRWLPDSNKLHDMLRSVPTGSVKVALLPHCWNKPTPSEKRTRYIFFVTLGVLSIVFAGLLSEIIWFLTQKLGRACKPRYELMKPGDDESKEELALMDATDKKPPELVSVFGNIFKHFVFVLYFVCFHATLYVIADYGASNGLLLGQSGLVFELYGILVLLSLGTETLFWCIALIKGFRFQLPHPSLKIVERHLPVGSAPFDNAKDYVMTAMCFSAGHCATIQKYKIAGAVLGSLNLLFIFLPVPFLFVSNKRVHDLWEEYIPAFDVRGVPHELVPNKAKDTDDSSDGKQQVPFCTRITQFIDENMDKVVDAGCKNCTSAKAYLLIEEVGQAFCSAGFVIFFHGSPFVYFSLVVSCLQILVILYLRFMLRRAFLAGYGSSNGLKSYARTQGWTHCQANAHLVMSTLKYVAKEGGFTPVQRATMQGNKDLLQALNELQVEIFDTDNMGRTPAHWAALLGNDDSLRFLYSLKGGSEAFFQRDDVFGDSVTHLATEKNKVNTLQTLHGLNSELIHLRGWHGETPLHLAAKIGLTEALHKLLALGARVEERDDDGSTAAFLATKHGKVECLKVLSSYGADLTVEGVNMDRSGNTLAHLMASSAVGIKGFDVLDLSSRINDIMNNDGWLPIHVAAASGNVAFFDECQKRNVQLRCDVLDKVKSSPAHLAARSGHPEVLFKLEQLEAKFHEGDKEGDLPIHLAVKHKQWKCVEALAQIGARTNLFYIFRGSKNADSLTPLELLEYTVQVDSVELHNSLHNLLSGKATKLPERHVGNPQASVTGEISKDDEVCGMEVLLMEARNLAGFSFHRKSSFEAYTGISFEKAEERFGLEIQSRLDRLVDFFTSGTNSVFVKFRIFKDGNVVPQTHVSHTQRVKQLTQQQLNKQRMTSPPQQQQQSVNKFQQSDPVDDCFNPRWYDPFMVSSHEKCIFRVGGLDPQDEVQFENIVFDFEVMKESRYGIPTRIASIQLPATQRQFATNPSEPFKEIWLPLKKLSAGVLEAIPGAGLHIQTLWRSRASMTRSQEMPGISNVEICRRASEVRWPQLSVQRLREPLYGLEVQYGCFNPNLARDKLPTMPSDVDERRAAELSSAVAHLQGFQQLQTLSWEDLDKLLVEDMSQELQELVQGGIPGPQRRRIWSELADVKATPVMDPESRSPFPATDKPYQILLDRFGSKESTANAQIIEDVWNLASWETSNPPLQECLDRHQNRLQTCRKICCALAHEGQIVYCESLMVLAYFLLLPQGTDQSNTSSMYEDGDAEGCTFSLLHTLITNDQTGILKEYFGKVGAQLPGQQHSGTTKNNGLYAKPGAMDDVTLLECCLAHHEAELWWLFNKLGFQLCTIFYGAFMRLYATYIPTASVFRFWDLFFGRMPRTRQGEKAVPHGRSYLINLAFGIIKENRCELLQCESAYEIRSILLNALGALFNTDSVVELTLSADRYLWRSTPSYNPNVIFNLWVDRAELFQTANTVFLEQNQILAEITHESPESPTTKQLITEILPKLYQDIESFARQQPGLRPKWAMHRPLPLVSKRLTGTSSGNTSQEAYEKPPPPCLVGPAEIVPSNRGRPGVEPTELTSVVFERVLAMKRSFWKDHATTLWKAFTNRREELLLNRRSSLDAGERISLNEMVIALICCSRGTLADKAAALFNFYSHVEVHTNLRHISRVGQLAKGMISVFDGQNQASVSRRPPPEDETRTKSALDFKVHVKYDNKNLEIGEFVVPSLAPYMRHDMGDQECQTYNLWGRADWTGTGGNKARSDLVVVGEIQIYIAWLPESIRRPARGQLCIILRSLEFYKIYRAGIDKLKPVVTVHTYRNDQPFQIPREDPRGVRGFIRGSHDEAYGGQMQWLASSADWKGKWIWSEKFSRNHSQQGFEFDSQMTQMPQRKNAMDIQGVRLIVTGILNRSMFNVTNRDALLIADSLFNRQGAVPGILEAVLTTRDEPSPKKFTNYNLKEIKETVLKNNLRMVDVTREIVFEHERQVQLFGFMNLFTPAYIETYCQEYKGRGNHQKYDYGLKDMNIIDPFPAQRKSLWIRFVRGGDGERCTQGVCLDYQGNFGPEDGNWEIQLELLEQFPQTGVTKAEFIACILNNPLLGESLRGFGAVDRFLQEGNKLNLDVKIVDPHQKEAKEDFMDLVTMNQSVLLECFSDRWTSKTFLGEAWLPPLGSLPSEFTEKVLPLRPVVEDDDGDTDRPDPHHAHHNNAEIAGDLTVQYKWVFPAEEEDENDESMEHRAKIQEQRHTGELQLRILHAKGLGVEGQKYNPQVTAWVRNDVSGSWRQLGQTKAYRHSRNPKWSSHDRNEITKKIVSGAFEHRLGLTRETGTSEGLFHEIKSVMKSAKAKRREGEKRAMKGISTSEEEIVNIRFEAERNALSRPQQHSHSVTVSMSDTIQVFKSKLMKACEEESAILQVENKWRDMEINYRHLVMVFIPSPKLRKLWQRGEFGDSEYSHAYQMAIQDPSSWQPLDPNRTFAQYPMYFEEASKRSVLIRVVTASEDYKAKNLRYAEFQREITKAPSYEDINDQKTCYGYAKHWHVHDRQPANDGNASADESKPVSQDYEWRPAIIRGTGGKVDSTTNFTVDWIFQPLKNISGAEKPSMGYSDRNERGLAYMTRKDVIFAPRCPALDPLANTAPAHYEYLEQARILSNRGLSYWEMAEFLNEAMYKRWSELQKQGCQLEGWSERPSRITVDILRNYMTKNHY